MTYEEILNNMLKKVPSDVDKREGSIIYDALAPAAAELAQMYIQLEYLDMYVFAEKATDQYLTMRCAEHGVNRKQASKAIRKGVFNIDIPIGSRFSIEDITYKVIENIKGYEYKLQCEQLGAIGNRYTGALLPIDFIKGLKNAQLTEILVPGEDEETDEELRKRYFEKVRTPPTSGNKYHYRSWAKEVTGVGEVKVFPLWDGPGTVKVVITDSDKHAPSPEVLKNVIDYIEEKRPIGAKVTVNPAMEKEITINAKVNLAKGYNIQDVQNVYMDIVENYFESIAFNDTYISYAKLGKLLLETDGIIDYIELKVNGITSNIPLADEEIPLLYDMQMEV